MLPARAVDREVTPGWARIMPADHFWPHFKDRLRIVALSGSPFFHRSMYFIFLKRLHPSARLGLSSSWQRFSERSQRASDGPVLFANGFSCVGNPFAKSTGSSEVWNLQPATSRHCRSDASPAAKGQRIPGHNRYCIPENNNPVPTSAPGRRSAGL